MLRLPFRLLLPSRLSPRPPPQPRPARHRSLLASPRSCMCGATPRCPRTSTTTRRPSCEPIRTPAVCACLSLSVAVPHMPLFPHTPTNTTIGRTHVAAVTRHCCRATSTARPQPTAVHTPCSLASPCIVCARVPMHTWARACLRAHRSRALFPFRRRSVGGRGMTSLAIPRCLGGYRPQGTPPRPLGHELAWPTCLLALCVLPRVRPL